MNKQQLYKLLKSQYHRENWKEIINAIFPNRDFFASEEIIDLTTKQQKELAQSIVRFGNIDLDEGRSLSLYEFEINPTSTNLSLNRVGLRSAVASIVNASFEDGALIAFYRPDQQEWRFSFYSKTISWNEEGQELKKETHPKRYTYILGPTETCKTPADRFSDLIDQRQSRTLEDVIKAFSVEKVSKEFFSEYKEHYQNFVEYITGERLVRESGKWKEKVTGAPHPLLSSVFFNNKKHARDFCKKMLGRIVFLYFVQKKGWLGATDLTYKDGPKDFICQLFEKCSDKDFFYTSVLSDLFFETLNSERTDDNFTMPDGIVVKVPFLNGGLFERDKLDKQAEEIMSFPPDLFSSSDTQTREVPFKRGFLDFLNAFNFTVHEDNPEEQTVAVDPEMLGHIFENLLEDNKDKGAFYTPKPIVHYMCQESLIEYLISELSKNQLLINNLREGLEQFIQYNNAAGIIDFDEFLLRALREVKVCDPAIGSGAFPMGILQEVYHAVESLHLASPDVTEEVWELESWNPAKVKLSIIQNSIYGVDLEKGAVDIARLRFWLTLIVDEEKPSILPNLDYRIMQGNSLLESFGDINLRFKVETNGLFEDDRRFSSRDVKELKSLAANYFMPTSIREKQEIKGKVDSKIKYFIQSQLDTKHKKLNDDFLDVELKLRLTSKSNPSSIGEQKKREKKIAQLQKSLEHIQDEKEHLVIQEKKLYSAFDKQEFNFFLWHLWFSNVFEEGGFDIVIGNPPYVQLQKMGKEADLLAEAHYQTFTRTGDIYCLFYELGIKEILKPGGVLTYITSNKWMRAAYGESLRHFFLEVSNPVKLIDFGGYQVFETATVDTNILVAQKKSYQNKTQTCLLGKQLNSLNNLSDFIRQNSVRSYAFVPNTSWVVLTHVEAKIKSKIEALGTPLKNWDIYINRGVLTGYNEAFIIDEATKKDLIEKCPKSVDIIRPILRGRDIKRYNIEFSDLWLLFIPWHFPLHNDPSIKGASSKAEEAFREQYPGVYNHLYKNKEGLMKRNVAETGIRYEWYALQRYGANYWKEFSKPKITWGNLALKSQFAFSEVDFVINAPSPFISTDNLYLLAVLNSKVGEYYIKSLGVARNGGYIEFKPMFVEQLPVPIISNNQHQVISELVKKILLNKKDGIATDTLEKELNCIIYDIYNLTRDEKMFLESI